MPHISVPTVILVSVSLIPLVACGGGAPAAREATPAPPATTAVREVPSPTPVPHESCTQETPVEVKEIGTHDMTWTGNGGHGKGNDPHVVLFVPDAGAICGLRLRFTLTTTDAKPAVFQVFWRPRGGAFSEQDQQSVELKSSPAEQTVTAWVNGPIDAIRIDPNIRPVDFQLASVAVLKPPAATR